MKSVCEKKEMDIMVGQGWERKSERTYKKWISKFRLAEFLDNPNCTEFGKRKLPPFLSVHLKETQEIRAFFGKILTPFPVERCRMKF